MFSRLLVYFVTLAYLKGKKFNFWYFVFLRNYVLKKTFFRLVFWSLLYFHIFNIYY
ncbi:hypothetical protein ADIS_3966 [Lunatimonas lonarensis]|uniref:Uncharacterized protein n=1 Tax=Lunatimonas lonarensis TaxID=1232681 RepID=R7ZNB0_9BACT|nr:hypothetical protein ADIS_3966 [Lunatimonas lonarensis]